MHHDLPALGFDEGMSHHIHPGLDPARVVAVHRGRVAVRTGLGPPRLLPVAGTLGHTGTPVVVGDWVGVEPAGAVRQVLPRRGVLRRIDGGGVEVLAANVDLALIVTSANQELSVRRVERFLALVRDGGVLACVVLTKADLVEDPVEAAAGLRARVGAPVVAVSARTGAGVGELARRLPPGATSALVGSSGVGKSTLVNALLGEERQVTREIREDDGKGRHATTHRELFVLPGGALLVDTPGIRLVAPAGEDGLASTFADVDALSAGCRFADCAHDREPGCAVQAAIVAGELPAERLGALRRLERETRAARRPREKHVGRSPRRERA